MAFHIYCRIIGYVVTAVLHITNCIYMLTCFQGEPMKNAYIRHFSEMQLYFFTCWTFTFQTVYSMFALYCDIKILRNSENADYKLPKRLAHSKDLFFTILVWPATIVVVAVFWPFYFYDRNLLYPKDVDLAIPNLSNHIMHSYIFLAAVWEVMFTPRTPPRIHIRRILGVISLELSYIVVLLGVHKLQGVWVYPIFGKLAGSIYFPLFFTTLAILSVFIYYTQWYVSSLLWRSKMIKKVS